jgi:hypothetical protein
MEEITENRILIYPKGREVTINKQQLDYGEKRILYLTKSNWIVLNGIK